MLLNAVLCLSVLQLLLLCAHKHSISTSLDLFSCRSFTATDNHIRICRSRLRRHFARCPGHGSEQELYICASVLYHSLLQKTSNLLVPSSVWEPPTTCGFTCPALGDNFSNGTRLFSGHDSLKADFFSTLRPEQDVKGICNF